MYEAFFGLRESPFTIAPNPRYLYMSGQHNEALAHLTYGVTGSGGFIVLTGEVGTGKTTVCRCFLEQIPAGTDVAIVLNPRLSVDELLATICDELGIFFRSLDPDQTESESIKHYVDAINHHLLQNHARGRKTVLIIDEAQNLDISVLEQLRLLTNLETNETKLLQIVLLGQPELREVFERRELRQLAQRITARYHLDCLTLDDTRAYVKHRLAIAGSRTQFFSEAAIKQLYKASRGIPRLINVICDRALLGAYVNEASHVDGKILRRAVQEVEGKKPPPNRWSKLSWRRWNLAVLTVIPTLVILLAIINWVWPVGSERLSSGVSSLAHWLVSFQRDDSQKVVGAPQQPLHGQASASLMRGTAQESGQASVDSANRSDGQPAIAVQQSAIKSMVLPRELDMQGGNRAEAEAFATGYESGNSGRDIRGFNENAETPRRVEPSLPALVASAERSNDARNERGLSVVNRANLLAVAAAAPAASPVILPTTARVASLIAEAAVSEKASRASAFSYLFGLWGIDYPSSDDAPEACQFAESKQMACLRRTGSLSDLMILNRPAVLDLINGGLSFKATLINIAEDKVQLNIANEKLELPKAELEQLWRGRYTLVWKMPPTYHGAIVPGTIGPEIRWLSQRLGAVKDDSALSAGISYYDETFQAKVKQFQRDEGLEPDGIVGAKTLIKLNTAAGETVPLLARSGD